VTSTFDKTCARILALSVGCASVSVLTGCAVVGNAMETTAEVQFDSPPAAALSAVGKAKQMTLLYNGAMDTAFAEEFERTNRYTVTMDRSIQAPGQMTASERRARLPGFCPRAEGVVVNIRENQQANDNNGAAMIATAIVGRLIVKMGFEIDVYDCMAKQSYVVSGAGKLSTGTVMAGNDTAIRRLGGSTLGKELLKVASSQR
jgi:hypothetical protein